MARIQYKISKSRKKKPAAPASQAVLLSGFFDAIEHGKKRFELTLKNGERIKGRIDEHTIAREHLRRLWGRRVTIKGVLYFHATGKPKLLEAHALMPAQAGDELLETIRASSLARPVLESIKDGTLARTPAEEIWGKWPGEESIEQLLEALKTTDTAN